MIWLLVRIAFYFALTVMLILGLHALYTAPGGFTFTVGDAEYGPFSFIQALAGFAIAIALVWLGWQAIRFCHALIKFFAGDETALSRFWNRARERRGFDALSTSLLAMAEGDPRRAVEKAKKAERLLKRPDVTRLISAQAAEAAGDSAAAKRYYRELASDKATAFAGVAGLLRQAVDAGDSDRALKLARHAFTLKPREKTVLSTLFDLQSGAGDWSGARATIAATAKAGALPKEVAARRAAVLTLADAQAADAAGETARAADLAISAAKSAPGLVPAAVAAARAHLAAGSKRKALSVLETAWRAGPHPDIAAAFAAIDPEESPEARRKRFGRLIDIYPSHPESRQLEAEVALAAGALGPARKALDGMEEESARVLALRAAIERAEGASDNVVRGYLAKALSAPRGPRWRCDACGTAAPAWRPVCGSCKAFDSLSWSAAADDAGPTDTDSALAPILFGAADAEDAPGADAAQEAPRAATG